MKLSDMIRSAITDAHVADEPLDKPLLVSLYERWLFLAEEMEGSRDTNKE